MSQAFLIAIKKIDNGYLVGCGLHEVFCPDAIAVAAAVDEFTTSYLDDAVRWDPQVGMYITAADADRIYGQPKAQPAQH